MRQLAKIAASAFLLSVLHWALPGTTRAIPEDAILAVVNDDVITSRDLEEYLRSRYLQLKLEGVPEDEIKARAADLETNALQRIIQDKLILNEANRQGIVARKQMIDARVQEIKRTYPSEEIFLTALERDGVSLSDLRKKIENQLKVQQIVETEIKNKIYVNPQEVTDYYNAHLADFKKPERVNLDSIFVSKKNNPEPQARAQEALKLIQSGENFRKVAEKFSNAPALGPIEKGKLLPQLEAAAWSLSPGQFSSVLEVEDGFYILKVLEKTPVQTASLEETKDWIQKVVFNEKFVQKINEWLVQLEKSNFVEIRNEATK